MIDDTLRELDNWLKANEPELYQELQEGLSSQEAGAFEQQLTISLPPEFKKLLRWRNGQSSDSYDSLFFNFQLMRSDAIAEAVKVHNQLLASGEYKGNWWNPGWVPFLDNGGGDHYCIDTAGVGTGEAGQIVWFLHDNAERKVMHHSFGDWLTTLLESFKAGLPVNSDDFGVDEDDEARYQAIYERVNKGLPVSL
ncbi:MAG: SMI1/KNR4 family protein [Roseiflexaceae bacterium]|nr:SMI1/KNR4 family protein [Roseiflexaceae bacterium]